MFDSQPSSRLVFVNNDLKCKSLLKLRTVYDVA